MNREFTAVYHKEGDNYSAWVEEVPGVNTQGKTMTEAKSNLKDALSMMLETNKILSFGKVNNFKREPLSVMVPA